MALPVLAFAQRSHEFGFSVKTGTLQFPHSNVTEWGDNRIEYFEKIGSTMAIGCYGKFAFGKRVKLFGAAQLDYAVGYSGVKSRFYFESVRGVQALDYKYLVVHSTYSLLMPLKIQYLFGKNFRSGIMIGGGYSLPVSGNIKGRTVSVDLTKTRDAETVVDWTPVFEGVTLNPNLFWTLGYFRRLNENTSIGMEFAFINRNKNGTAGYFIDDPYADCFPPCYSGIQLPDIRSLYVTIEHNVRQRKRK